jgi:hypothetical protein
MPGDEREFTLQMQDQRCDELMALEYWYQGRIASEWNVLFLKIRDGSWVRFFFDAGVFFWKKDVPSRPEDHEGSEYRLVKPTLAKAVEGRTIVEARFTELKSGGRTLTLELDDGMALHLHNENDRSSVAFVRSHVSGRGDR